VVTTIHLIVDIASVVFFDTDAVEHHRPRTPRLGRCSRADAGPATSSTSPSPTSSLITALPGHRHLVPQRVPPPLCSACPPGPDSRRIPVNARACTARNLRQPRRRALTAYLAPANLLLPGQPVAQGGLGYLSVVSVGLPVYPPPLAAPGHSPPARARPVTTLSEVPSPYVHPGIHQPARQISANWSPSS